MISTLASLVVACHMHTSTCISDMCRHYESRHSLHSNNAFACVMRVVLEFKLCSYAVEKSLVLCRQKARSQMLANDAINNSLTSRLVKTIAMNCLI